MKSIATASLFAALFVATTAAIAGEHDRHAPAKPADAEKADDAEFAKLDTDKDGFISKSELPAKHPLLPHFGMVDKNRDAKLDRKEFEVASKMMSSMSH